MTTSGMTGTSRRIPGRQQKVIVVNFEQLGHPPSDILGSFSALDQGCLAGREV